MYSIGLITKTKITAKKVSQKLIDSFPYKKRILQNDENELYIGFIPREFFIMYDDSKSTDDPDCLFEEWEKKLIPFENALYTNLFYRDENVAKYAVKIIVQEYPELIVNDEDNEYLTAEEYLKKPNIDFSK